MVTHKFEMNIPLAPLTTLGVGGNARYFSRIETVSQLCECIQEARDSKLEIFVLGGGSNLLVADAGFDGVVLSMHNDDIQVESRTVDEVLIKVGAGCNWDAFVSFCVDQGLSGIECLSGIPGRVGAAPIQNIGAYGQEVSSVIESVDCVDRETSELVTFSPAFCAFGYRTSVFKAARRNQYVVTHVNFRLSPREAAKPQYPELIQACGKGPFHVRELREAVLALRRTKSMVYDSNDPNHRSAGSFFVNPIVDQAGVQQVLRALQAAGISTQSMPLYEQRDDRWKLSAAWLIDQSGFKKGYVQGRVGLSSKHCLAIVNLGGASAAQIVALARTIQATVNQRFGVRLTPEPHYLGGTI